MPLKTISPILTPDLLYILAAMGHGDEIVIVDVGFPTTAYCDGKPRAVRCDGLDGPTVLEAILKLFPLDTYVEKPTAMMDVLPVDKARNYQTPVLDKFRELINKSEGREVGVEVMERFAFYDRCKNAFAIVHTGEKQLYGHIILKKGLC